MATFNAKTATPVAVSTIAANDRWIFGDVSLDSWEVVTMDSLLDAANFAGTGLVAGTALQTTRRNAGNTANEWAVPGWLDKAQTWAGVQTFTGAPVFTDASGARTALGLGTAATVATGTSGATIPLLSGTNTWANPNEFDGGLSTKGVAQATISNVVLTSNVVTVTTGTHGFKVGQWVVIAAVTQTDINGIYQIASVPSTTTFTYALTHANIGTGADTGTANIAQRVVLNASGVVAGYTLPSGQDVVVWTPSQAFSWSLVYGGSTLSLGNSAAGATFSWANFSTMYMVNGSDIMPYFKHSEARCSLRSGDVYGWSSSSSNAAVANDTTLSRLAAAVVGTSWLQNTAGRARLTASVTNVTTTFANLTDLTLTAKAGRKYFGVLCLTINNGLAADGFKLDFNGGDATWTSVSFGFAAAIGATLGTRTATAIATALTLTVLPDTNDLMLLVPFSGVCNAAGTLIVRQAKAADAAGATLTTRLNSYLLLEDSPN